MSHHGASAFRMSPFHPDSLANKRLTICGIQLTSLVKGAQILTPNEPYLKEVIPGHMSVYKRQHGKRFLSSHPDYSKARVFQGSE